MRRPLSLFSQNRQTKFSAGVAELRLEGFVAPVEQVAELSEPVVERGPTAKESLHSHLCELELK